MPSLSCRALLSLVPFLHFDPATVWHDPVRGLGHLARGSQEVETAAAVDKSNLARNEIEHRARFTAADDALHHHRRDTPGEEHRGRSFGTRARSPCFNPRAPASACPIFSTQYR